MFEVRIITLFHATKWAWAEQFQPGESVAYSRVKTFEPTISDFETRFTSFF